MSRLSLQMAHNGVGQTLKQQPFNSEERVIIRLMVLMNLTITCEVKRAVIR